MSINTMILKRKLKWQGDVNRKNEYTGWVKQDFRIHMETSSTIIEFKNE